MLLYDRFHILITSVYEYWKASSHKGIGLSDLLSTFIPLDIHLLKLFIQHHFA